MQDDNDHSGVILEIINDRLDSINEGVGALASVPGDITEVKERLTSLESKLDVITSVVTSNS